MKFRNAILTFLLIYSSHSGVYAQISGSAQSFDFLGNVFTIDCPKFDELEYTDLLSGNKIEAFYRDLNSSDYRLLLASLHDFRDKQKLDDWLYYQLIRKAANHLSPKAENYTSYTIFKWFLLIKSGYDARLRVSDEKILFYVNSDETIYNIPLRLNDTRQYVLLNYHDYNSDIDFENEKFQDVVVDGHDQLKAFTYKVTQMPDIKSADYVEKELEFNYNQHSYHFKVKLNPDIKTLFTNYPAGDYSNHFNIPLSRETYNSLILPLKDIVGQMKTMNGVDYLMRFTRYAFLYERDTKEFGKEKRLSPEETLFYDYSDCEDRSALFFYLVKEIYNLPMIVLAYSDHVTVAVQFEKPSGKTILYNGVKYSVCEPTPQQRDLKVGQLLPELQKKSYEIVYAYTPDKGNK